MSENLRTVLGSVVEVFGLVGIAYLYARRTRCDTSVLVRVGMDLLVPCLAFSAILESDIQAAEFSVAAAATLIQISTGLLIGWAGLRILGWEKKRELLLPIAFVNSANLPFPLLLANFGAEGLSRGVLCYTVTNLTIFSLGIFLLRGRSQLRAAFREPALWASVVAAILRFAHLQPPEIVLRVPRLAGQAAVPVMLLLFGFALARTRWTALRFAVGATFLRYFSGAVALGITLLLLRPEGMLRKILILYALLPSAVVNAILAERAGSDAEAVASTILLATVVSIFFLPIVLLLLHA